MKILYVEDNPDAVHPIQRIASYLHYEFLVAETIADGMILLSKTPNLVLVDMMLPDGNAIDFTQQARKLSATLPIIVVTGITTEGEREACLAAGATAYYIKPLDIDVLISLFRSYADDS